MTETQTKAEAYVRQQLPELYNPLNSICSIHQETLQYECELCQSGWMSPQLQHWLRVLNKIGSVYMEWHGGDKLVISICDDGIRDTEISLNLTTGQPATEVDYQAFNDIVGI